MRGVRVVLAAARFFLTVMRQWMVSSCLLLVFLLDLEHHLRGVWVVLVPVKLYVTSTCLWTVSFSKLKWLLLVGEHLLSGEGLLASSRPLEFFVNTTEEAGPRVRLQVRVNRFLDSFR